MLLQFCSSAQLSLGNFYGKCRCAGKWKKFLSGRVIFRLKPWKSLQEEYTCILQLWDAVGLKVIVSGRRICAQNILPATDFLDLNLRTMRTSEC